nr:MAG TPA: hypothetical protein [Caudoviricetes sp.]
MSLQTWRSSPMTSRQFMAQFGEKSYRRLRRLAKRKHRRIQQIRQQLNLPQHWKKSGHFPHRNLVQD